MNSHGTSYASRAAEADRKRAAAKKLIEQYYYQLTEGCGNPQCDNEHCASNTFIQKLEPNQAAALALRLFKAKARLCISNNIARPPSGDPKFLEGRPSHIHEVPLPSSQSMNELDIATPTEEGNRMDISSSCDGESGKGSAIVEFPSSHGVNSSSKKIALSSYHAVNSVESSNASSETGVSDSLSKLSQQADPAHVESESSGTAVAAEMPSPPEETSCMEVSDDTVAASGIALPASEGMSVPSGNVSKTCWASPSDSLAASSSVSELHSKSVLPKSVAYLDEERLKYVIEQCQKEENFSLLIRTLGQVFSSEESLQCSFTKPLWKNVQINCKEDIRAMEVDEDKDKDSKEELEESSSSSEPHTKWEVTVDVDSLRRAYKSLFSIKNHPFQHALINALIILSENLEYDFKYGSKKVINGTILNIFVIVMEIPILECPEYMEAAFPAFCKAAAQLPVCAQAKLAQFWSTYEGSRLKEMIDTLHQFITLKVITGQFMRDYSINDDETIVAATKLMKVLYYANMLGGVMDNEPSVPDESENVDADDNLQDFLQGAIGSESKEQKQVKEDPLSQELGFKPINCRTPIISFEEFYNEPLSDQLEMDRDFACYKTEGGKFSFMNYAFILTPAVKALGLYYDNRIRMYSERRISVLHSLVHGAPPNPYLKLRVRRDHIIDDALVGLEMVAMENPNNLKKQLVVEFEGEQGIDEGGVSKEFFQLVVEEVFNPDFAMFTLNPETQMYWFNPTSFESDAQFTLIGIILGLAIYNNIILDVHFPMVLYRKLMGKRGTFYDLQDWNPSLSKGLQDLLSYEGDDIESVFLQTFRITYQDVFGTVLVHDLKEDGDNVMVNQSNKKEFVELYADFLLNKSVQKQFRAFKRGFQMVTDDSPLKLLFRPEEIELLVCGSKNFDFNALEESTDYDGGYTAETPIIRWFWELVHDFSLEQKQKLLQFATGSDRVPVGGLSKLKLVIARHGPDSERLPTAHTCFNVLLLPEYSSKVKLEERLLKAINYSKGFGML